MMVKFQFSLLITIILGLNECISLSLNQHQKWDWDHFVFAQQWSMSACIDANNITHDHDCHIPSNVTTWTVHGLWPSLRTSQGPEFCNVSSPGVDFDPDSLAPILAQLAQFWPNLYRDSQFYGFWKHEWCKHGTCAVSVEDVDKEVKYFGKGIDLRKTFDLSSILSNGGITPSDDKTYEYVEFMKALVDGLGAQPKIACVYDKETKTQYIAQIEFCLSKQFEIIQCPTKHSETKETQKDFVEVKSPSRYRNAYIAMHQKRKSLSPESCESQPPSSEARYGQQSSCRDYEPIAYPVIKHF